MLGIRYSDELFDGYLVEETMWGRGLIWGCKEEEKEVFMVLKGCMNSTTRKRKRKRSKREEKRRKEEKNT